LVQKESAQFLGRELLRERETLLGQEWYLEKGWFLGLALGRLQG
jgi:hypothetical protein